SCLKESYATSDVLSAQWDRCNAMINTVKRGGSSVADYYHRLKSLWRESDALTKLPKCTCEVKCSCHASKEKFMQFLMGLDDYYQPVRSSLLTRDPLPEVKDAYNVISREESHRGVLESSGRTGCFEIVGFPQGFKINFNSNSNTRKQSFNANFDVKMSDKSSSSSLSSGFTS
ncbi:ribonuclease H-like domain-containing protein, partial [Tanacetum coccineum]